MERRQEDWIDGPLSVRSNRYGEDVIVVSLGGELDRSNVATAKGIEGCAEPGPRGDTDARPDRHRLVDPTAHGGRRGRRMTPRFIGGGAGTTRP